MAIISRKLRGVLSTLVAASTIVGIPAGLYGYFAGQREQRVEKTFEFYKEFRADSFQKDWALLVARWNGKATEAKNYVTQKDIKGLQRLEAAMVADDQGGAALENVLSFFDELSACVENSLCDRNAAVGLFTNQASQIAGAYGAYIISIRDQYNNAEYGSGLMKTRALTKEFNPF